MFGYVPSGKVIIFESFLAVFAVVACAFTVYLFPEVLATGIMTDIIVFIAVISVGAVASLILTLNAVDDIIYYCII